MEQPKYDVFISYSRKDYVDEQKNVIPGNEVSKIKEALTEAGITYWFDEEGVYHGDEFAKVIAKSIKASRIFVFLSTVNSNWSEWTANEISTAYMLKKKIIPVRIDDSVYHDDVILYISRLSHVDYCDNPEKGRQELVRSIKAYLAEERIAEEQKIADEKCRQEELERQRKQQEEEKRRQEQIAKVEAEIAALEAQRVDRKKIVLQKEQELKLAQVDLLACEEQIGKQHDKLQELRENKTKAGEKDYTSKMFTVGDVSFKMIFVDGGKFKMGSPDYDFEAFEDEKSQQDVTLGSYYIGETPVTQALWQAVMKNNPSVFKGENNPVDSVSWDMCQEFMKKLNQKVRDQLSPGFEFRLPTEAEWEFAARGGKKSQDYKYAGRNRIDEVAWYEENSENKTHPVKQKRANELGLYDMSGNVMEWCQDLCGSNRVLRGGSWSSDTRRCRTTNRSSGNPSKNYDIDIFGFRLALVHQ